MLKELLSIFRAGEPLAEMGAKFAKMLGLTYDMTIVAGEVYFSDSLQADAKTAVYKTRSPQNRSSPSTLLTRIVHASLRFWC